MTIWFLPFEKGGFPNILDHFAIDRYQIQDGLGAGSSPLHTRLTPKEDLGWKKSLLKGATAYKGP